MLKPDIRVHVETAFVPEQSDAESRRYVFAYTITIRNTGALPARLVNRHWLHDARRLHRRKLGNQLLRPHDEIVPARAQDRQDHAADQHLADAEHDVDRDRCQHAECSAARALFLENVEQLGKALIEVHFAGVGRELGLKFLLLQLGEQIGIR